MLLHLKKQPNLILCVPTIYDLHHHFDKLFNLWHEIEQLPIECLNITVDFHYCEFLGHNGVAFLGGLVRLVKKRGGQITFDWDTLPPKLRINLAQNGFLSDFGHDWQPWDGNSIPYRSDLQPHPNAIMNYLQDKWLGKGWVSVSSGLRDAILGQVWEIYTNAFKHGQSVIGVFSCGQHYPNVCVLQLTVIDFGIGIPANVRSLPQNSRMSTTEALKWAFQPGTSTKQGGVSQRTGLNLLQEFVTKNHGTLMIFSNDGYAKVNDNGVVYENRSVNFSGTLVNIALQCDDSYYCLASEVSPSSREPLF